jgi:hypothetical protein
MIFCQSVLQIRSEYIPIIRIFLLLLDWAPSHGWQSAELGAPKVLGSNPTFFTKHITCLVFAVGGLK